MLHQVTKRWRTVNATGLNMFFRDSTLSTPIGTAGIINSPP